LHIGQPRNEPVQLVLGDFGLLDMRQDRLAGEVAIGPVRQRRARRADDACRLRKLPGELPLAERRQELAFREIAGGAENDEIEWVHGNGLTAHERLEFPLSAPASWYNQIDLKRPVPITLPRLGRPVRSPV